MLFFFVITSILSILLLPLQLSMTPKHTNNAILNSSRPDNNKYSHDLSVDKKIHTVLIALQFLIFCADSHFQLVLQIHKKSDFENHKHKKSDIENIFQYFKM